MALFFLVPIAFFFTRRIELKEGSGERLGVGVAQMCRSCYSSSCMKQTIIIGADHAGFALKEKLVQELCKKGYDVEDLTPSFNEGDDYPAIGRDVAETVASKKDGKGILVCGSGIGMTIAANRINGARAILAHDVKEVEKARIDDMVNILCFSGWNLKLANALKLIEVFLKTKPSKAARHLRRVKQLG